MCRIGIRITCLAFALACPLTSSLGQDLIARSLPSKPATVAKPSFDARLTVKFRDHLQVRAVNGDAASLVAADLRPVWDVVDRFGLTVEPLLKLPQETLSSIETRAAEKSGNAQPDLAGFVEVIGAESVLEEAANALLALTETEWVEFSALYPVPTCSDASPTTPDYFKPRSGVSYHDFNPGVNARCAWKYGGRGAGIDIGVVDEKFITDHEDLCNVQVPVTLPPNCVNLPEHGTAALGEVVAVDNVNDYGWTGLAPESPAWFFTSLTTNPPVEQYCNGNTAAAITNAIANLGAGDVMYIELGTTASGLSGSVPAELDYSAFAATSTATDAGIVVVEPAANGTPGNDLDDTQVDAFNEWRSWYDQVRVWLRVEVGSSVGDESIAEFDNYRTQIQVGSNWVAFYDPFTGADGSPPDLDVWTPSNSSTDGGSASIQSNRLRMRSHRSGAGAPSAVRWLQDTTQFTVSPTEGKKFAIDFVTHSGNAGRQMSFQIAPSSYDDSEVVLNGDPNSLAVTASDDAALAGIWLGGVRLSSESPLGKNVRIEVSARVKVFYDNVLKLDTVMDWVDSGAILVGAGTSDTLHDRLSLSNYGSRVNVQGWGEDVFTLGCLNACPGCCHSHGAWYTGVFSGTSSATPMVAGAAAVLQSLRVNHDPPLPPLSPRDMRQLLVSTGIAQGSATSGQHIGPIPDVGRALLQLGIGATDTDADGLPDLCEVGACCHPFQCSEVTQSACNGDWYGPATTCVTTECNID